MNKKFYFALALTAGLFASCSSDDIAQAPQGGLDVNDPNGDAIQLVVSNAVQVETRGTGTVGGTTSGTNKWAGQKMSVFMFDKGYLDLAVDGDGNPIYGTTKKGTDLTIDATGTALLLDITANDPGNDWVNQKVETRYFPTSGSYDFWGYRLDDAAKGDITGMGAHGAQTTGQATIAFEIDGTQDIMVGKAMPKAAADGATVTTANNGEKLSDGTVKGTYGTTDVAVGEDKIYSAYSARRQIQPKMSLKHLLSRFTFNVKGANMDACIADNETDPEVLANGGVRVTDVKVNAKTTGNLVVAYTGTDEPNRITWDYVDANDFATNKTAGFADELPLKQRASEVDVPQTGEFRTVIVQYNGGALDDATSFTYSDGTSDIIGVLAYDGVTVVSITDALPVYDSNETYATTTNKPKGNVTTIANVKQSFTAGTAANKTYYYYALGTPVTYKPNTNDVTADLIDLEPVTPLYDHTNNSIKTVEVGESMLLPAGVREYDVDLTIKQWVTESVTKVLDANGNQVYTTPATAATKLYWVKVPVGDAKYTKTSSDTWTGAGAWAADATHLELAATAVEADVDAAAAALTSPGTVYYRTGDGGTTAEYVYYTVVVTLGKVTTEYYQEYDAAFAATANQATIAAVENDASGNHIKHETKTGKDVTSHIKHKIHLALDGTTGKYKPFEAGKSYNVVITISGTEASSTTEWESEQWKDGEELTYGDDDEI